MKTKPQRRARRSLTVSLAVKIALFSALAAGLMAASGLAAPVGLMQILQDGVARAAVVLNPPLAEAPSGQPRVVLLPGNIHAQPDPSSAVLGQAKVGMIVHLLEQQGSFGKIHDPDTNLEGWLELKSMPSVAILNLEQALQQGPLAQAVGQGQVAVGDLVPVAGPTPPSSVMPSPPPGGVTGSGGVVVSQALRVRLGIVTGATDAAVLVSDDGARFTIAVEAVSGSTFTLKLALVNSSNRPLNGELTLNLPAGSSIGIMKADGVTSLARFSANTWKFTLAASHNNLMPDLIADVRLGFEPGFQAITGGLKQVAV